jgi:hypothetical protein
VVGRARTQYLCVNSAQCLDWSAVTIDELKTLASAVEPIGLADATAEAHREAAAFNVSVARFRELVVRARNGLVQGRTISPKLAFEIRTLAEALPAERLRTGGARGRN